MSTNIFGYLELWKHAQYCYGFSSFVISTMMLATLVFCGLSCFTPVKEDHFRHFCSIETSGIIFVRVLWNRSRLTLGLTYSVFLWRKKLWLASLFDKKKKMEHKQDMWCIFLVISRFERLNGSQILKPLLQTSIFLLFGDLTLCIMVTFKKGSMHGRASLLHL